MSTQQPESLRLAEILEGDYCPDWFYEQGVDEVAAEMRRLHAENEALQQVYDAARLEIDHLRGATKMMDPAGEYPPLPRPFIFAHESGGVEWPDTFDATQMRTYADATCAMRAQAAHAAAAWPDPADEDDHKRIRILRRGLNKSVVLAALLRHVTDAARAQAKEGGAA